MNKFLFFLNLLVCTGLISSFVLIDDASFKLSAGHQKKWRLTYMLLNGYDITDSIPCFKNAEITFSQDHAFSIVSNCSSEISGKYELFNNQFIIDQDTFELEVLEEDKLKYSKMILTSASLDTLKIADIEQKMTFLLYPIY